MTCVILIALFLQYELSYDRYHEKSERIFRVVKGTYKGGVPIDAYTPYTLAATLDDEFPEVVQVTRIYKRRIQKVSYGDKKFDEEHFAWADANVFDIFTFPLAQGNSDNALKDPYSVVMTEETAERYFGVENPVGKIVSRGGREYRVTGILQNIPANSHFKIDFLASLTEPELDFGNQYFIPGIYTYVLLHEPSLPVHLEEKLALLAEKYKDEDNPFTKDTYTVFQYFLQPLTRIHFHSHLKLELARNGNINFVYLFIIIALLILFVACINFMNLATARSAHRAREIGMRKVVGAQRIQLIRQFLGEALFQSFISLLLAVVLVELFLPVFNALAERELELDYGQDLVVLLGLAGIALLVGIVSGSYPAFFLSAFRPVDVLKGNEKSKTGRGLFRRGLVVFQFAVSITLMLVTGVIFDQLSYMHNKKMGFDKEGIVVFPNARPERWTYQYLKNKLVQHPEILSVTVSTVVPGRPAWSQFSRFRAEERERDRFVDCLPITADFDFLRTLGMELANGRSFREDLSTDIEAFIINEEAARQFEWDNPIGRRLESNPVQMMGSDKPPRQLKGEIIGVVKDFHLESLHHKIKPVVIRAGTGNLIVVRFRVEQIAEVMSFLEQNIRDFAPSSQFKFFFLDDELDRQYRAENKLFHIFGSFALVGILVTYLGIFGLAAFTAERRTKEIGIRKVLGASVVNIVSLLSREFGNLVIIANIIAWPIAYFAMADWLHNFAYRIDLAPGVFALGGVMALMLALVTVSMQAIKAAIANPVETLRSE